MPAAERGDVGRLCSLEHVAGGEGPQACRPEPSVGARSARPRIELEATHDTELMIGNPVRGENDCVTGDQARSPALEVEELDLLDPRMPADAGDRGTGQKLKPVAQR